MKYRYRNEEEMKDSGVEWIGKVPKSWNISRIGKEFVVRNEKVSDKEYQPLSVTKQGILLQLENVAKSDNSDNRKRVCIGDFVINSRADRKGSCGISPYNGSVSLICNVLTPKYLEPKYVHNLFRNYYFSQEFYRWGSGIVDDLWSTNIEKMKKINIPIPKKDEDKKIATFLDDKTTQFDSIISKKEALIQKLEEAKKSLISEVVTGKVKVVKTSDGYELVERKKEEMKDSRVEWLGCIPQEWNITKLKLKTVQINRGKSPEYVEESEVKVINQACIYWDEFKLENVKYQDESIKGERGKVYKGDILINSTGTGTLGRTNIFNEEGNFIVDSHVTIIRCFNDSYAKYLKNVLRTDMYQGLIYSTMVTGSTNQIELSREGLRNMVVLDFNCKELHLINNLLDIRIGNINKTITKIQSQIEKLKQAKQSLISELVTGKIEILD